MRFTSQHGPVDLGALPVVSGARRGPASPAHHAGGPEPRHDDIARTIEQLAELKTKGILSAEEFAAKKGELLARL